MPNNRIAAALIAAAALPLLAWAQVPGPSPGAQPPATKAAEDPPTEAEKLLDAAIAKVRALESVSADIQQDVKMLGLEFRLSGQYLRAPRQRVYLKLELSGLGDTSGTMLQISDGVTMWEYKKVLELVDIRRRTLGPIMEKLDSPDCDQELREQVLSQLGFAGPEALLVGLRKAVDFDQKEEGELDGQKVWVIRGRWQDRASLTSPGQPPMPATGPLPPYVPSLIYVWIGQEDGWPMRVRLVGRAPSIMEQPKGAATSLIGDQPLDRPAAQAPAADVSDITLAYTNVRLNPELGPEQFAFLPPEGVAVSDETTMITEELTRALADRAARRKAEAAKGGPELPSPIDVPGPPLDTPPPLAPPSVPK